MKNLVFFLVLNLLVNFGFSSNIPYKYHSINEIEFTKIKSKYTLKKLFAKEINTYAFDTKNSIINHCKSIFNKNNNSAINDITIENWMNFITLGHTSSTDVEFNNELNLKNLSASSIIFILLGIIVLLGLWIVILIIRSKKYKNEKKSIRVINAQNKLLKKEFKKYELLKNLKDTPEDLNIYIVNIKKLVLLKKQLDNIDDEKSPDYNEKETLKKLKLCLNSFFDNYRELTQMMHRKLNVDKIVEAVRKDHPEISDKEIRVIEYIALHFTTKEMALLMDKSEKSVEYYRTQIRKKIQLNSSSTIEEYLNAQIM
jgi:DNA-binding CsgD family transcriptional regulator